ncbi:MAG: CRISPR-associated protein Cas2 [Spirochaetales bacterium]|jgi:CRISPR-associated protein Cas2
MFVSAACDYGNEDSRIKVDQLLLQYGFRKVQKNLYESTSLSEKNLARLKLECDKLTDFYDTLRLYQFPMENTLVITSLEGKKWKRSVLKP